MPKTKTLDMDILRSTAVPLIFMLNISHQFAFFSDAFTFLRLLPYHGHTLLCKCLSGIRLNFKDFFPLMLQRCALFFFPEWGILHPHLLWGPVQPVYSMFRWENACRSVSCGHHMKDLGIVCLINFAFKLMSSLLRNHFLRFWLQSISIIWMMFI